MIKRSKAIKTVESELTRRSFIKASGGAIIAASCVPSIIAGKEPVASQALQGAAKKVYVCPPCGLDCDKLTFDSPGTCPQCGMTLVPVGGGDGFTTISILIFDGAEIIDFAGPWEAFGTAGYLVHTVGEGAGPYTLVFGQKILADYTFDNAPKSDVLLVPGGGITKSAENAHLLRWLRTKSADVRYVMSVCTGAFILAAAGLLDGLDATVTYGREGQLAKAGKNINVLSPRRYVDTGKIITTAGLSSGIDGAFHLISKISGKGEAQAAALAMEYHWSADTGFSRAALADRFLPDALAYGGARFGNAKAKLISTDGDTDHWEIILLVSEPATPDEIADLLRKRITANASEGNVAARSHMRGEPRFSSTPGSRNANMSEFRWNFTDDQGSGWVGAATVNPAPDDKQKSVLTIKLSRDQGTTAHKAAS